MHVDPRWHGAAGSYQTKNFVQALGKRGDVARAQPGPAASGVDPAVAAASDPPSSGPSSIRSMFTGLGGLLGAASASLAPIKVSCNRFLSFK